MADKSIITRQKLERLAKDVRWAFTRGSAAKAADAANHEAFSTSHRNCAWNLWHNLEQHARDAGITSDDWNSLCGIGDRVIE